MFLELYYKVASGIFTLFMMRTTLLVTVIALLYCCTIATAQELIVPKWLTCEKVNYTYNDRSRQWNSLGKYWLNANFGDNKSFYTANNNPYVLMRLTYGSPVGEPSTNAVIRPSDQECTTQNGYGLASLYIYFQLNGTYEGKETINGVRCARWYAELSQEVPWRPSKYLLWVTEIDGFSVPVRFLSVEYHENSELPEQTTFMDFLTMCHPKNPPPFTFNMPTYCPLVNVPHAASPRPVWRPPPGAPQSAVPFASAPRVVWRPPPSQNKEEEVANAPRVIWKPPPPPFTPDQEVANAPRVIWKPPPPPFTPDQEVANAPRVIWKPPPPPEINVN